jgi:RNA polymerase sigma-70 factor (ECF subfamily)
MSQEHKSFTMIFNEHYRGLCKFLETMMGRRHLAEEIAQESFLRLYKLGDGTVRPGEERFWLYRVAHNLALNEIRKRETPQRLFHQIKDLFRSSEPTPQAKLEQEERRRVVQILLHNLPEAQRAALLLREQQEMSYREIASVLSVSESKVKVDIFRARNALRVRWKEIERFSND